MTIPDEAVQAAEEAVYKRHERGFLIRPLFNPISMHAALKAALPFLQGVNVDVDTIVQPLEDIHTAGGLCKWTDVATAIGEVRRLLSAIEVFGNSERLEPSPRAQALEEAAQVAENWPVVELKNCSSSVTPIQAFSTGAAAQSRLVAAAIRALSSQPVAGGWLPIETAPKDTVVDLWCVHTEHAPSLCRDAKLTNGQWSSGYFEEPLNAGWTPTHWRPLPASPGASE